MPYASTLPKPPQAKGGLLQMVHADMDSKVADRIGQQWAAGNGAALQFIQMGKPVQNAHIV